MLMAALAAQQGANSSRTGQVATQQEELGQLLANGAGSGSPLALTNNAGGNPLPGVGPNPIGLGQPVSNAPVDNVAPQIQAPAGGGGNPAAALAVGNALTGGDPPVGPSPGPQPPPVPGPKTLENNITVEGGADWGSAMIALSAIAGRNRSPNAQPVNSFSGIGSPAQPGPGGGAPLLGLGGQTAAPGSLGQFLA